MLAVLNVVLPVFLIIATGYMATRTKLFPDAGIDGLIAFVIKFAIPALLLNAMYRIDLAMAFEWRILASFYTGALTCFVLGMILARKVWKRSPGEAVAVGFSALFSNTVLIGLAVMTRAYGEEATQPMFGIIALHAPLLYTFGIICMEIARRDGADMPTTVRRVLSGVFSNALMLGILTGLALNMLEVQLPETLASTLMLLAAATMPTALFSIGAALTRYRMRTEASEALMVSVLLLLVHPGIAYVLSQYVFELSPEFVRAAVVTAAMPAGLNIYIFAAMYDRATGLAASALLLSTVLSIATITLWLTLLGGAGIS